MCLPRLYRTKFWTRVYIAQSFLLDTADFRTLCSFRSAWFMADAGNSSLRLPCMLLNYFELDLEIEINSTEVDFFMACLRSGIIIHCITCASLALVRKTERHRHTHTHSWCVQRSTHQLPLTATTTFVERWFFFLCLFVVIFFFFFLRMKIIP